MEQLERIVVVTDHDDHLTQKLCQKYSVDCIRTHVFYEDGDKFNKGRAINLAMGHLRGLEWILHMDADILLPHNFKNMLHRTKLNPDCIYGADRANVFGYDHWMEHKPKITPHYEMGYFVDPPKEFPIGARIVHFELGWCPIGYFQLWHKSLGRRYPIHQGTAEHTDVLFAVQWAREHRVLLPEVVVYHLDPAKGPQPMGENWNGRKSPLFTCHEHSKHHHHGCHHHKHHPHHPHPYCPGEGK